MKFSRKTQVYEVTDREYRVAGYVCFQYTGQKMVKDFAKSKKMDLIIEPLDTVVYDSIEKKVVYVFGPDMFAIMSKEPLFKINVS